jgi:hypothetical protein
MLPVSDEWPVIDDYGSRYSRRIPGGSNGPPTPRLNILNLNRTVTVMSREHWHLGTRSDYITALALSRSHVERHDHVYSHSRPLRDAHAHMPKRLQPPAIPDLRFEPTYLAKLATAGPGWRSAVWVTVRDQVISPLVQGALWYVPRATHGSRFRPF